MKNKRVSKNIKMAGILATGTFALTAGVVTPLILTIEDSNRQLVQIENLKSSVENIYNQQVQQAQTASQPAQSANNFMTASTTPSKRAVTLTGRYTDLLGEAALDAWVNRMPSASITKTGVAPISYSLSNLLSESAWASWVNEYSTLFDGFTRPSGNVNQFTGGAKRAVPVTDFNSQILPLLAMGSSGSATSVSISSSDKTISTGISFNGALPLSVSTPTYSSFNITWGISRDDNTAMNNATAVATAFASKANPSTIAGAPSASYSKADIITLLGLSTIPNFDPSLLNIAKSSSTTSTISINSQTKSANFSLWYPKDGKAASSVQSDNLVQNVSLSWGDTRDGVATKQYFGTGSINISDSNTAPTSLSASQVLALFNSNRGNSNTKPSTTVALTIAASTGVSKAGSLFNLDPALKTFTFNVSTPADGHSGSLITRPMTINYSESKNTADAQTYFNGVTLKSTFSGVVSGAPTLGGLTLSVAKGFLDIPSSGGTSSLIIFDGAAPTINAQSKTISFNVKYPRNGVNAVDGYHTKSFTINYAKTQGEIEAAAYLSGFSAKSSAPTNFPPAGVLSKATATSLMNIPARPAHASDSWQLQSPPTISNSQKAVTFTIAVFKNGFNSNDGMITKTISITYSMSINENGAKNWFNALSTTASKIGAPSTTYNISSLRTLLGISGSGPGVDPSRLTLASPVTTTNTDKSITFTLNYPDDGVTSGTLLSKSFTVTFTESRDERAAKNWFRTGSLTHTIASHNPGTISYADLQNAFITSNGQGNMPAGFGPLVFKKSGTKIVSSTTLDPAQKSFVFTVEFPSDGKTTGHMLSRQFTVTYNQTKNEHDSSVWFNSLTTSYSIASQPGHTGTVTLADVKAWMNNPTPPSPLSASIALVTPPSISDTTHTLSVVINFPTNGVSGSRGLSKTITFNFAKSIKQVDTAAWWGAITSSKQTTAQNSLSASNAPSSITLTQIKNALGLSSGTFTNAMWMTEKNQTRHINSYNVKGAEHSVTLTIHSLTNNPFNATEETTFDLTFTFVNSIDEQGVTAWANALQGSHSEATPPPAALTKAQILSLIGASSNPVLGLNSTATPASIKYNGGPFSTYHPTDDEKTFAFTLTYFNNGVSGATTDFTFTLSYGETRREKAVREWFASLANPASTINSAPPGTGNVSIQTLLGWIGTSMPKPALVTAGLEFVGTQPSVNDMTHQLSFQLKIGKNGHDATDGYLSIRSFVVNFARTQKQDTTKTWFDGLNWNSKNEGAAPTSISLAEVKALIGTTSSDPEFGNIVMKLNNSITNPYTLVGNTSTVTLTIEVPTYAPSGSSTQTHNVTINWSPTLDMQATTAWANALNTASTPTSPTFTASGVTLTHPPLTITKAELNTLIGLDNTPKPTLTAGSIPGVVQIRRAGQTSFITSSYSPTTTEKVLVFEVIYFTNGVSGATSTHTYTLTYGENQTDYFQRLVGPVPQDATNIASGGVSGHYTPSSGTFGIVTSHVPTTGIPLTLNQLKAIAGGAFTTTTAGLSIDIISVTNVKADPANPLNFLSRSEVVLEFTYQGIKLRKTLNIDYQKADIKPLIDPTGLSAELNSIISTTTTSTHDATITVPVHLIDYLKTRKLGLTLHLGGVSHNIDLMSQAVPGGATDIKIHVPSGVLDNTASKNSFTLTVSITHPATFTDPSGIVGAQESAFSKLLAWDVYIDTAAAIMWKTPSQLAGISEITGTDTDNWGLRENNNPAISHFQLEVRWVPTTGSAGAWTKVPSFVTSAYWDQTTLSGTTLGALTGHLESRLVPATDVLTGNKQYVLSADRQTTAPLQIQDALTKVIKLISPATNVQNNIMKDVKDFILNGLTSVTNTHAINWGTTKSLIDAYMTKNHMSIQYSLDDSTWSSNLPTEFEYISANRNFYIKVSPDSGFKFDGVSKYNLALSLVPKIRQLIGWINNTELTSGATPGLVTTHTITGTTNNPTITLDGLKTGLKYEYSVNNGVTWTDEATFKNNMKNIWLLKSDFKYRVIVTDPLLYLLSGPVVANFDVSNLKTYIDVTSQISDIQTITAKGQFGTGQDIYIALPSTLTSLELAKQRVKLQFQITGASAGSINDWTDVPVQTTVHGQLASLLSTGIIPGNNNPVMHFRLVPFLPDATTIPTSAPNRAIEGGVQQNVSWYEGQTTSTLSNYSTLSAYSTEIILPTIVTVGPLSPTNANFTSISTDPLHTKSVSMTETEDAHTNVVNANSGITTAPNYWNFLKIVYTISDGTGSKRFGFTFDTFQKWLRGEYAVGTLPKVWEVENASGTPFDQIEMRQITLPSTHKVPDWNELDMSSIQQRWATTTTKDQFPTKLYAASGTNAPISVSNFANVLKWWDTTNTFNVAKSVYITGNTHQYVIDENNLIASPLNTNSNFITNGYLNTYGLKRQFSLDGINWLDTKPVYDTATWQQRVNRRLYMRVVPVNPGATSDPFVGSSMFVHNPVGTASAEMVTTKVASSGDKEFRTYVIGDTTKYGQITITGNQFMLHLAGQPTELDAINESLIDTNSEDTSVLEIEYLYNGAWYNKADLVSQIQLNRTPASGADLSSITFPTDFAHSSIKARWHLIGDAKEYVMSSAQSGDRLHALSGSADSSGLKDFVNIWHFESEVERTLASGFKYSVPKTNVESPDPSHPGETLLSTPDYTLGGSLNAASLVLTGSMTPAFLNTHHLLIQYSTVQEPSSGESSADWVNASKGQGGYEIFNHVAINNQHKSLWIRVIIDPTYTSNDTTVSSYLESGNGADILPIKIDATRMTFEITTRSSALTALILEGTTQALTSIDANHGVQRFLDGTSNGIDYQKQVAGQSTLVTITSAAEKLTWTSTNGITVRWKVTQSRQSAQIINGNTVNTGDEIEFDTLAQLQAALASGKLNFDISTLKVQWGILPSQQRNNHVSDSAWITPTNTVAVKNIIFTTDYLTFTDTSVELTGNTVATVATTKPAIVSAIPTGVKIQYSEDNATWTDVFDGRIDGTKNLWIRLEPISVKYELKDTTHSQLIKVNSDKVYTAVILTSDGTTEAVDETAWVNYLQTLQVSGESSFGSTGYTTFGNFGVYSGASGHEAKQMPLIPNAQDATTRGHWEYTTEQIISTSTIWHNSLHDAMEEYYGSGTKAFDKDKITHFTSRYILDAAEQTLSPGKMGYTFTDKDGNVIQESSMQYDTDITSLTQYLYIDNPDSNIPEEVQGSGVYLSWRDMAGKPKFLPGFNPAASGARRTADLTGMEYLGQSASGTASAFKFDVNPYDSSDLLTRSIDNALAPRHAHFEYSTKQTASSLWTAWSTTPPIDRPLESNNQFFKVRIVADAGYAIPDASVGIFGSVDQNWERLYPVIIVRNTENLAPGAITFIGFDDGSNPVGRLKTDDATGDFTKGAPLLNLIKSATPWDLFKTENSLVLEYNVYNAGSPISWTDQDGTTAVGWHSPALAPSSVTPWYGSMPVSLKNGDVLHVRIRAKNGYKLSDSGSLDDQSTGMVNFSKEIVFPRITTLITELTIPNNFAIFDTKHRTDFTGAPISQIPSMPTVTFGGSEGTGTMSFSPGAISGLSNFIKFEVQILRPISVSGKYFNEHIYPSLGGYNILDSTGNVITSGGSNKLVFDGRTKIWTAGVDDIADTWVDPATVNYLRVGDAIRIRVVSKTGYGFKWEDEKTPYSDIGFLPKERTHYSYNTGGFTANSGDPYLNTTPLPVTDLLVKPHIVPADVTIIHSTNPALNLNGVAQMVPSQKQGVNDKWKLQFQTKILGGSATFGTLLSQIPTNLKNGDQLRISIVILDGYKFDPTYVPRNIPVVLTISGLKDMIDLTNAIRPEMDFSGYQGKGTINSIWEQTSGAAGVPIGFQTTTDANGFKLPGLPSSGHVGAGVKWQYQVAQFNPSSASEGQVSLIPWIDTLPTDLQAGWFVRMRVAPVDPIDVVLTTNGNNKKVPLYSWTGADDKDDPDHKRGWIKVHGLKINPANIDMKLDVTGFIGKTSLGSAFTILVGPTLKDPTLDESSIIIEYSDDGINWQAKATGTHAWDDKFGKLTNGDHIWMRAKPKTGLIFDATDPAIVSNQYYLDADGALRKSNWDNLEVTGLQKYLDVSAVILKKPHPLLGLANYEPMVGAGPDLVSGKAQLVSPVIDNIDQTKDLAGNKLDSSGVAYSTYLKVQYTVERMNIDSGQTSPPFTSDQLPKNLKNGDRVLVKVVSTNPDYKLSNDLSASLTVAGLQQIIQEPEAPKFVFTGEDGSGTVFISNGAPSGFTWEYLTYPAGGNPPDAAAEMWSGHNYIIFADGSVDEYINVDIGGGVVVHRSKTLGVDYDFSALPTGATHAEMVDLAPSTLSNGDNIKVRLVSILDRTVARAPDKNDPNKTHQIISEWKVVSGLQTIINLGALSVKIFDKTHPFNPDQDTSQHAWTYAFAIEGHQEESAIVKIAATIDVHPGEVQLLDTSGNPLPFADKLAWEFAVDEETTTSSGTAWSRAIPQGLVNGKYIHARLAVRSDVAGAYAVKNFVPLTFKVPELDPAEQVSSKVLEFIGIAIGAVLALAATAGAVFYMRTRKKFNLKGSPKM